MEISPKKMSSEKKVCESEQPCDSQYLVSKPSTESFQNTEDGSPEITITRNSKDSRKYSTMCFQTTANQRVDIIITRGEYSSGKQPLLPSHASVFMSSEYIQQRSVRAKCCFIFLMLIILGLIGLAVYAIIVVDSRLHALNENTSVNGTVSQQSGFMTVQNSTVVRTTVMNNSTALYGS